MIDADNSSQKPTAWGFAVQLLTRWIEEGVRVDALLDELPRSVMGHERGRCQNLLFGALRNKSRLETAANQWVARPPRPRLKAILLIAGFELLEGGGDGHVARVVHHAVEQSKTLASPAEARLVNAVVRKMAGALAGQGELPKFASASALSDYFSHPEWLVQRWLAQYGAGPTRALLEWNQKPAPVYARWRHAPGAPSPESIGWLSATPWPGFYEVAGGHWGEVEAALRDGWLYLQDPSTRCAIDLLDPKPGETFLDACAAPGGKSVAIVDRLAGQEAHLVAMDLPGARMDRLWDNLGKVRLPRVSIVEGDLLDRQAHWAARAEVPLRYAGVLLDVPCSNTGVMRHRVDVRWRLRPDDILKHGRQQLAMLRAAADRVAPGGRLVYSTCSLDTEENEAVVAEFLKQVPEFTLEAKAISLPWEHRTDGAGAYRLRRS